MALQFLQVLSSSLIPFSVFRPCRNGKAKVGSNKSHNLRPRNFLHPKCPAWKAQIAKLDGKAELVVNPAMLANEMKIIGAQSVVPDTFVKVACGRHNRCPLSGRQQLR